MGTDQPTDQPTDRPTDRRTKRGVESRSTRLKTLRQKLPIEKKSIFALFGNGDIFLQTYAIFKQIKLQIPAKWH